MQKGSTHERFPVNNVLEAEVEDENWESQIWRPLDGEVGWFIIDLGCQLSYDTVRKRANKGDSLISYFHDMIHYNVPSQSPCKVYENPLF